MNLCTQCKHPTYTATPKGDYMTCPHRRGKFNTNEVACKHFEQYEKKETSTQEIIDLMRYLCDQLEQKLC